MKIELLVNLKDSVTGRVVRAGIYDSNKRTLPKAVEREVEHHRRTGRPTLRILEEDSPKPTTTVQEESMTTLDSQETDINTEDTSTKKKRSSRKKKTT